MKDSLSLLLESAFTQFRNETAVREWIDGSSRTITYGELWSEILQIVKELDERLNGRREVIAILGHRNSKAFASVVACLYAGFPFLPLNERYPAERLAKILKSARCDHVLLATYSHGIQEKLASSANVSFIPVEFGSICSRVSIRGPHHGTAYVIGTSGTTGDPKLIPISRENLIAYRENSPERQLYQRGERVSQAFDLSFDPAIGDILHTFLNGATLCPLADSDILFLGEYFRRERVDHWFSTPSMVKLAFASDQFSGFEGKLRRSAFIGERLDFAVVEEWKKIFPDSEIWNEYGPAECTIAVSMARVDCIQGRDSRGLPLGQLFQGMSYVILDDKGERARPGESGELLLAGAQVFSGYLNGESDAFLEFQGKRYYATGDLVTAGVDGELYFLGRKDHQVKLLGQRVECEEIEQFFRGLRDTFDVICLPWYSDETGAPQGIALCLWGTPNEVEIRSCLEKCKNQLPNQWVPKAAFIFSEFPLSEHKKQARKGLLEALANRKFQKEILFS